MKILKMNPLQIVYVFFLTAFSMVAQNQKTTLESGFQNPSNAVKPKTWMHVMSGNMQSSACVGARCCCY